MPEFQNHYARVEKINRRFEPYFAQIHARCCSRDIGINRFSSDWARLG